VRNPVRVRSALVRFAHICNGYRRRSTATRVQPSAANDNRRRANATERRGWCKCPSRFRFSTPFTSTNNSWSVCRIRRNRLTSIVLSALQPFVCAIGSSSGDRPLFAYSCGNMKRLTAKLVFMGSQGKLLMCERTRINSDI